MDVTGSPDQKENTFLFRVSTRRIPHFDNMKCFQLFSKMLPKWCGVTARVCEVKHFRVVHCHWTIWASIFKPWLLVFGQLHHFTTLGTQTIFRKRRSNQEQKLKILRIHKMLKTPLLKHPQTGAEKYVQHNSIARGPLKLFHPLVPHCDFGLLRTQNWDAGWRSVNIVQIPSIQRASLCFSLLQAVCYVKYIICWS